MKDRWGCCASRPSLYETREGRLLLKGHSLAQEKKRDRWRSLPRCGPRAEKIHWNKSAKIQATRLRLNLASRFRYAFPAENSKSPVGARETDCFHQARFDRRAYARDRRAARWSAAVRLCAPADRSQLAGKCNRRAVLPGPDRVIGSCVLLRGLAPERVPATPVSPLGLARNLDSVSEGDSRTSEADVWLSPAFANPL